MSVAFTVETRIVKKDARSVPPTRGRGLSHPAPFFASVALVAEVLQVVRSVRAAICHGEDVIETVPFAALDAHGLTFPERFDLPRVDHGDSEAPRPQVGVIGGPDRIRAERVRETPPLLPSIGGGEPTRPNCRSLGLELASATVALGGPSCIVARMLVAPPLRALGSTGAVVSGLATLADPLAVRLAPFTHLSVAFLAMCRVVLARSLPMQVLVSRHRISYGRSASLAGAA